MIYFYSSHEQCYFSFYHFPFKHPNKIQMNTYKCVRLGGKKGRKGKGFPHFHCLVRRNRRERNCQAQVFTRPHQICVFQGGEGRVKTLPFFSFPFPFLFSFLFPSPKLQPNKALIQFNLFHSILFIPFHLFPSYSQTW